MPYYQYVAEKGVLSGLKELGDNAELDRLLPLTIKLTEDYQDKISEESERASFLDDGITIYDLALEREFEKANSVRLLPSVSHRHPEPCIDGLLQKRCRPAASYDRRDP
ncbi:MAG: hypothetical protein IPI76_11745 [Chloracidobacterium sp.]|nr:hypothetical protein [Chloracidobacterium sp.]